MDINKTHSLVAGALFCALLFTRATCTKTGLDCADTKYGFQLPVKAYPDDDSIKVGDTIWFQINSSIKFIDVGSNQTIDYSKAENLGSTIGLSALHSDSTFSEKAVVKFKYILKEGIETNSSDINLFKEYLFVEKNQHYIFHLGLVAQEKGVYRIVFSNAANVYRSGDKCTKASFTINFKDTDQHIYLFPGGAGTPPGGGVYYFKVI